MLTILAAIVAGAVAGLVASGVMEAFQAATASLFGQNGGDGDPATVQLADGASKAATGKKVPDRHRAKAGNAVHYLTGLGLGIFYALLVMQWMPAAFWFGAAFGIAVSLILDDAIVPALGLGPWPWATPFNTHLYGLVSHLVFGLVLEGVRRLGVALLT